MFLTRSTGNIDQQRQRWMFSDLSLRTVSTVCLAMGIHFPVISATNAALEQKMVKSLMEMAQEQAQEITINELLQKYGSQGDSNNSIQRPPPSAPVPKPVETSQNASQQLPSVFDIKQTQWIKSEKLLSIKDSLITSKAIIPFISIEQAWEMGAANWEMSTWKAFINDANNRGERVEHGQYIPALNRTIATSVKARCEFIIKWSTLKTRFGLASTTAERSWLTDTYYNICVP